MQDHLWGGFLLGRLGICYFGVRAGHPQAGKSAGAVPVPGLEKGALGCPGGGGAGGFNGSFNPPPPDLIRQPLMENVIESHGIKGFRSKKFNPPLGVTFGGVPGRSRPGFGSNMCPSGGASIRHKPGASEGGSVGEVSPVALRTPSVREPFFRASGLAAWWPIPVLNKPVAS